jgi:hypothetical protein
VISESNDAVVESHPGTLSLRSLTRPFKGRSSEVDMVFVYIPRDLYPEFQLRSMRLTTSPRLEGFARFCRTFSFCLKSSFPLSRWRNCLVWRVRRRL